MEFESSFFSKFLDLTVTCCHRVLVLWRFPLTYLRCVSFCLLGMSGVYVTISEIDVLDFSNVHGRNFALPIDFVTFFHT